MSLIGIQTEYQHLMRVAGDRAKIAELKRKLTATNKQIVYKIKKLKETLRFWKERASYEKAVGIEFSYAASKAEEISNIIKYLKGQQTTEYWLEENGELLIPAGFWNMLDEISNDFHINREIDPVLLPGLRDYQKEAVLAALQYKRATVVLATGLGKTMCISSVALSFVRAGKRVFIVVPTEYLVTQVYETITKIRDNNNENFIVTAVGGKRKAPTLGSEVMVCTSNSAQKYVRSFDVLIFDESHHTPASTWKGIILAADKAEYVYNFTATAFRSDGLDIGINAFGGPVVYQKDVRWGIANGWLSDVEVFQVEANLGETFASNLKKSRTRQSAYKKAMLNQRVIDIIWSQLYKALQKDKKIIMLFKTLTAANAFKKALAGRIDFTVADGKNKKPLVKFCSGESRLLVATDRLVSEGVDVPDADVLFLLTQHSSPVITYQSIGRVIRFREGKEKATVIDLVVSGYPEFEVAGRKRISVYEKITNNIKKIGVQI